MAGGGGYHDAIDYSGRSRAISVTDDGIANDGAAGEGDDVLPPFNVFGGGGFEIVKVGSRPDTVSMSGSRIRLFGFGGDDHLSIGGGPGTIFGGIGDDALAISGAPGRLRGGPGADSLSSADSSVDHNGCGPGHDDVTADASDVVNANCEDVTVAA